MSDRKNDFKTKICAYHALNVVKILHSYLTDQVVDGRMKAPVDFCLCVI